MHRRALALVLGVAILAAAAPVDADPERAAKRLLERAKLLRPPPGRKLRARRGDGVLGAGWVHMASAVQVAQPGAYAVALPRELVESRTAPGSWGRQRRSQWCWAATSQMILDYLGLRVTLEDVIVRAYGGYLDRPATPLEIAMTLDGWQPEGALGIRRTVRAASFDAITSDIVVNDLAGGRGLIVGLRDPDGQGGHAFVLSAMTYDIDAAGRLIGRTVTLRDRWPDSPSIQEISWGEVASRFMGAVRIELR